MCSNGVYTCRSWIIPEGILARQVLKGYLPNRCNELLVGSIASGRKVGSDDENAIPTRRSSGIV